MQLPGPTQPGPATGAVDCVFPIDFKMTRPFVCECTQTEQTLNTVRVRRAHALIRSRSAPKGTTAAAHIAAATEGRRVAASFGRSGYARFQTG